MSSVLKQTLDVLQPMRPPTQPSSDIADEQKKIQEMHSRSLILLQVALLTILIAGIVYLVVPAKYANPVAFLLLCVGIAVGIFLSK